MAGPLVPAAVASPYLEREARLIALTIALAPLRLEELDDAPRRAALYAAAALGPVADEEDREACRRSAFYWRRIRRPDREFVPPPLAPVALEPAHA